MDDGTSSGKAIPLRRSRTGSRAVAGQPTRWSDSLTGGLRYALEPPRQVWLVGLGSTAITIRGARAAWSLLVSEGAAAEAWLRRSLVPARKTEAAAG